MKFEFINKIIKFFEPLTYFRSHYFNIVLPKFSTFSSNMASCDVFCIVEGNFMLPPSTFEKMVPKASYTSQYIFCDFLEKSQKKENIELIFSINTNEILNEKNDNNN